MPYLIGIASSCKGRIFQPPQLAEANGSKVANVILAVDKGQDTDGNRLSDFIDCSFWGRDADLIMRYPEGHEINIICGKLNTSAYMDKSDKPRVRYKMTVYVWQSVMPLSKEEHNASNADASSEGKLSEQAELTKKAIAFKFTKGKFAGKTVLEVLEEDYRFVYDLCNNERVAEEMRNLLKIAYNYWYYNKKENKSGPPQKSDYRIEGVKRNNVKRVATTS